MLMSARAHHANTTAIVVNNGGSPIITLAPVVTVTLARIVSWMRMSASFISSPQDTRDATMEASVLSRAMPLGIQRPLVTAETTY
jgi:hypothetical protein